MDRLTIAAWPARKNAASNPYQSLLSDALEVAPNKVIEFEALTLVRGQRVDILHVHWPDVYLASSDGWRFCARLILLQTSFRIARYRTIPVVWTAHNLQRANQRNGKKLHRHFWPWFLSRVDGIIYLTQESQHNCETLNPILKQTPSAVIPHGHYGPILTDKSHDYRSTGQPRVLGFGALAAYKRLHLIVEAFALTEPGDVHLTIAGATSKNSPDLKLIEQIEAVPRTHKSHLVFKDSFLSDSQLEDQLAASDLAVFPYEEVESSGAAILALSAGCPILTSNCAPFRELRDLVGAEWVTLADSPADPGILVTAARAGRALRAAGNRPDLSSLNWERVAQQTVEFYLRLRGDR